MENLVSPTKFEYANKSFICHLTDPWYIKISKSGTEVDNRLLDLDSVKIILKPQLPANFMILKTDCTKWG